MKGTANTCEECRYNGDGISTYCNNCFVNAEGAHSLFQPLLAETTKAAKKEWPGIAPGFFQPLPTETTKPAATTETLQAKRHNAGKPKLSFLLSAPNAIDGVAKVMEFGMEKYGRDNWKLGLPYTEVLDSLLRHASAFNNGEDLDSDSGLPHADHILTNALFLAEFIRSRPEKDDRIAKMMQTTTP